MQESGKRGGDYKRCSGFVEVEVSKSDNYSSVTKKISDWLGLPDLEENECFALFKLNGSRIMNKDVSVHRNCKPWIIGNYLSHVKKSASNVKLGIGVINTESDSEEAECTIVSELSTPDTARTAIDNCGIKVAYTKKPSNKHFKISREYSREELWRVVLGREVHSIDNIQPFQPEDEGFMISSIQHQGIVVVSCAAEGGIFKGYTYRNSCNFALGEPLILFQSPKTITVPDLLKAVPLVCIPNLLDISVNCRCQWKCITRRDVIYSSSPILYVQQIGMYRCVVVDDAEMKLAESHYMEVVLEPYTDDDCSPSAETIAAKTVVANEVSANVPARFERSSKSCVIQFTEEELAKATKKDEHSLLGKGSYGIVYKAYLRSTFVAIKFLSQEGENALCGTTGRSQCTFESEIDALLKYRHENLVFLMGYCPKPVCIIYEYLEKGSLYDCLHKSEGEQLNWYKRSRILKGACRGLVWLHSNQPPLIHQDIKSSNVLIDVNFTAKLGDFGFSLEMPNFQPGKTVVTCPLAVFTQGYCAPEVAEGQCSTKSDVYSYGV